MKKSIASLLVAALALASAVASAETYAVIIGINDYPEPLDADGNPLKDDEGNLVSDDLKGCVNDAKFWQSMLTKNFGVKESNIHMLLDGAANKANFIREMEWLTEVLKPGDKLFFSYSGHGSQLEMSDQPEEEDGLTEVICLVDTLVADNYFASLAKEFRDLGVDATYEFDSCHSGGMDRDVTKKKRLARTKALPKVRLSARQRNNRLTAIEEAQILMKVSSARGQRKGTYAFIFAAQEDQTSSDVEFLGEGAPPPQGAFTYMAKRELERSPSLTLEQLIDKVKVGLKDWEYEQIPKAEYSDSGRPTKPLIIG